MTLTFKSQIHQYLPERELEKPKNIVEVEVCNISGKLPKTTCDTTIAYFVSGILAITSFVLMCIFVPWAWWLITLVVVGGFILLCIALALIFEGIADAL